MNKLWLITKTTFWKNLKSWGFWGMVLMPFIILLVVGLIGYFTGNQAEEMLQGRIAVVDTNLPLEEAFAEADNITIVDDYANQAEAEEALENDDIQAIVSAELTDEGDLSVSVLEYGNFNEVRPAFEAGMASLQISLYAEELDLSPEEMDRLFGQAQIDYQTYQAQSEEGEAAGHGIDFVQLGAAYVIVFFSFMILIFYAQTIINEISADKGTRMMEVILSSTSASNHFLGKLFGVGLLIMVQFGIYLLFFGLALIYFRQHEFVQYAFAFIGESQGLWRTLFYSSIFFVLAVAIYLLLSAFAGSLVTKSEDAAKAISPISILLVVGFYLGMFGMLRSENFFIRLSSYIPFFTPFVMPFRMATGSVGTLGILASIAISLVFVLILGYISITLYETNVLAYSDIGFWKNFVRSWKTKHN